MAERETCKLVKKSSMAFGASALVVALAIAAPGVAMADDGLSTDTGSDVMVLAEGEGNETPDAGDMEGGSEIEPTPEPAPDPSPEPTPEPEPEPIIAGLHEFGNSLRFGKADGAYAQNEWITAGGKTYYFGADNLALKNGGYKIGKAVYNFDASGALVKKTGWVQWPDGSWSLQKAGGAATTGWYLYAGRDWYYFSPDTGRSLRGTHRIDGKIYYFSGGSVMRTGWQQWQDGTWSYFRPSGAAATGWYLYGDKDWYYFSYQDGKSLRGEHRIDGQWYFFKSNSVMKTGWQQWKNGSWSYYRPGHGRALTGWQYLNGSWYYLNPANRIAQTGWQKIDGKTYFFNSSCQMQTGWKKWGDGSWSYFRPSGAAAKGWYWYSGGAWYYFDPSTCKSVRGEHVVDGVAYYFTSSSVMKTGWQKWGDGSWSYYKSNGVAAVGWQNISGFWYYLRPSDRRAVTGLQVIDGKTYHFDSACQMQTGWVQWKDGMYSYFWPSGERAEGTCVIEGNKITFDANGKTKEIPGITGNASLDQKIRRIANQQGSLRACFNWVRDHRHTNWGGDYRSYPTGVYPVTQSWVAYECGRMVNGQTTDCFAYAATFACLAKALGYDAKVVSGFVPRIQGDRASHAWVQIREGNTTYVYDANLAHTYPTRNFYRFTYSTAPISYWR